MDDWADKIPSERPRSKSKSSDPFWLLKTLGLGLLGVAGYYVFKLFSTPIMMQVFGPLLLMAGVGALCLLIVGLFLRFLGWLVSLPGRLFGR